jgi:hypothetical protein
MESPMTTVWKSSMILRLGMWSEIFEEVQHMMVKGEEWIARLK